MSEFFDLAGYTGNEYMQYANEMKNELPVMNTAKVYIDRNGELLRELDEDILQKVNEFEMVEYYWRNNFIKH